MAINQAGDKERYYVTCWHHSNGYPASDEIAAVEQGVVEYVAHFMAPASLVPRAGKGLIQCL
ncbi:hypothetical protein, partial [Bradyrhizobium sp. CCBAU 45321]|uniref:hypothetical protein n=1 Tax=Bradyrhizobium sp. CCBAU 45321 TaxID=1641878 RepID=UPI002302A4B7